MPVVPTSMVVGADDCEVRGRVVVEQLMLPEGKWVVVGPAKDAQVRVLSFEKQPSGERVPLAFGKTDAQGSYAFRVPKGRHSIEAGWPAPVYVDVELREALVQAPELRLSGGVAPSFATGLWLAASTFFGSRKTSNPAVTLPVASPPRPAAGQRVEVRDAQRRLVASGLTEVHGFFLAALEPGDYQVSVGDFGDGGAPPGALLRAHVEAGKVTRLDAPSNLGPR